MQSRKPGGFFEGMLCGRDHQQEQIAGTNPLKPLTDRALQGRYPPGSTFKMAVAAAALEEGVITPDFQVTSKDGEIADLRKKGIV